MSENILKSGYGKVQIIARVREIETFIHQREIGTMLSKMA